jgi:hypothetical protein
VQAKEKIKFPIIRNVELRTILLHCDFHYLAVHSNFHARILEESFELTGSVSEHI